LAVLSTLLVGGAAAAWLLRDRLRPALDWVHELGAWGLVVTAVAYIPAAVVGVPPASLLTVAAGSLYGVFPATVVVSLSSTFAATLAFLLGRTLARDWVAARVARRPLFWALDFAVAEQGFKIVLLTRLSPLFPYFLLNYAFGLTRVSLGRYVLASWIGMLPGTLMYVYLGASVGEVADLLSGRPRPTEIMETVLWWTGLAATVVVTLLVARQARRELKRALEAAPVDKQTEGADG
jgi:uncharacterized membrane protein YdjX (TVP38/TMEM64 family)